jgi:hypothetical protein
MSNLGEYGTWEEQMMERALAACRNGDMGNKCTAQTYSVPKATLRGQFMGGT